MPKKHRKERSKENDYIWHYGGDSGDICGGRRTDEIIPLARADHDRDV